MKTVESLIAKEKDGTLSFGNFTLPEKSKLSDFAHEGDLYKVKTFNEITKLEKNGLFVYESVPGTSVFNFRSDGEVTTFGVTGKEDAQITLELEPDKEYDVIIDGTGAGHVKTNLGGKLVFSVEVKEDTATSVEIRRV
ncbi:MAG: endosialidase [Lachnospiraceae bacterium]|nr:endosialidase [Lachnospiraceae bacterium]